jgi:hypothetical protein
MTVEVVTPDLVIPAQPSVSGPDPLDPCPNCGAVPRDAPEGVYGPFHKEVKAGAKAVGDAIWEAEHCWLCGFRPGVNQAVSIEAMRRQFDAYKAWVNSELAKEAEAKGLAPPSNPNEVADLKAQFEAMKAELEALRKG